MTEPWMRGTHAELDPALRAVVHALELAEEDVAKWCGELDDAEMFARPGSLPSVAFHLRHIVRSLDRLLTYADGSQLSEVQLAALKSEMDEGSAAEVLAEFREGISLAKRRVRTFAAGNFGDAREIGRKKLPATVIGLVIHCADHTQRHVGQVVTTVKVVRAGVSG